MQYIKSTQQTHGHSDGHNILQPLFNTVHGHGTSKFERVSWALHWPIQR